MKLGGGLSPSNYLVDTRIRFVWSPLSWLLLLMKLLSSSRGFYLDQRDQSKLDWRFRWMQEERWEIASVNRVGGSVGD